MFAPSVLRGWHPVRNDAAIPDRVDDLVLRDDTVAILDQEYEQRKDLRLHRNGFVGGREFEPIRARPVGRGRRLTLEPGPA